MSHFELGENWTCWGMEVAISASVLRHWALAVDQMRLTLAFRQDPAQTRQYTHINPSNEQLTMRLASLLKCTDVTKSTWALIVLRHFPGLMSFSLGDPLIAHQSFRSLYPFLFHQYWFQHSRSWYRRHSLQKRASLTRDCSWDKRQQHCGRVEFSWSSPWRNSVTEFIQQEQRTVSTCQILIVLSSLPEARFTESADQARSERPGQNKPCILWNNQSKFTFSMTGQVSDEFPSSRGPNLYRIFGT